MNHNLNILLVDDDPDDQEIFLSVIEGFLPSSTCKTAFNGQDALDKLLSNDVKPDVIFLDLNMPLMNGKQFLTEVKRHHGINNIPVIILSTSSDSGNIAETKHLGAKFFITKPDRFSEWEQQLKRFFTEQFAFLSK